MKAIAIAVLLSLPVAGCISYSSSPPPPGPATTAVVCLYAGQPYSPGAKVYPPNSPALQCRGDGSWAPL